MANIESTIDNLIALCHIINNFEDFDKKVISVLSSWNVYYNNEFIDHLISICKGDKPMLTYYKKHFAYVKIQKAEKFYNENKSVIDTINKYSEVWRFICQYYDCVDKSIDSLDYYEITHTHHIRVLYFYEYILKHKEDIEQILATLESIKKLGFLDIEFNEELDFTKEIYTIDPDFKNNEYIIYIANAKAIGNHSGHIEYKTINSNYKISLKTWGDDFYEYPTGKIITLNTLLLDSKTLPKSLSKEDIFEPILRLENKQKEQSTIIRNSDDLSICISDLENQLNSINDTISRLDEIKNKDELIAILLIIGEYVEKLKTLSVEHNSSVSEQEPTLTSTALERKKLSLNERNLSNQNI